MVKESELSGPLFTSSGRYPAHFHSNKKGLKLAEMPLWFKVGTIPIQLFLSFLSVSFQHMLEVCTHEAVFPLNTHNFTKRLYFNGLNILIWLIFVGWLHWNELPWEFVLKWWEYHQQCPKNKLFLALFKGLCMLHCQGSKRYIKENMGTSSMSCFKLYT